MRRLRIYLFCVLCTVLQQQEFQNKTRYNKMGKENPLPYDKAKTENCLEIPSKEHTHSESYLGSSKSERGGSIEHPYVHQN